MANLDSAYCHSCGKKAKGEAKVDEFFGYRRYKGGIYVQSHCRQCRARESYMRKKAGLVRHHNTR